ncbi:MAG: hypothetical protein A3J38_06800 [Gammaproteobacteria bacterium RIFCSPHIGHO2_12_FULL_45_9]|nr:MAG: hypothetical protein A3J38_06800 [Gammaproteobacteria bacterium RIFCSPHIGHO2_12_FULL_45_9]
MSSNRNSQLIGRLTLDPIALQKDLETVNSFPVIQEEYSEFGTGTWLNHSLWNKDGKYSNTLYSDYENTAQITELGQSLPYLNHFITQYFHTQPLRMVRLRNLIDGVVFPHKDFVELTRHKLQYIRVFIALETNFDGFHSDEHNVFRMRKGEVWVLDASIVHAAANFSTKSRKCLCLDFQYDEPTHAAAIFKNAQDYNPLLEPSIMHRTPLNESLDYFDEYLDEMANALRIHGNLSAVLRDLTCLHFHYNIPVTQPLEWLILIAERSGNAEKITEAQDYIQFLAYNRQLQQRFIMA